MSEAKKQDTFGEGQDRRGFIKVLAGALGSLLILGPVIAGAIPILGPLLRKRDREGGPGFDVRVASLDQVPEDGKPATFAIYGEERNVWNYTPRVKVGEVILARNTDGGIRAYSPICPHLGCAVQTVAAAASDDQTGEEVAANDNADADSEQSQPEFEFRCPCHNSSFNLDGSKAVPAAGKQNPSPRGMDDLPPPKDTPAEMTATGDPYTFADAEGKQHVYVRYQEFLTGRSEKIAKNL